MGERGHAEAELFLDGTNCADIEAVKHILRRHLAYIACQNKGGSESIWRIHIDLSRQNWRPTPEEEEQLASLVQAEKHLVWGRVLLPEMAWEDACFPEKEEDWKDSFFEGKTILLRQNLRSGQRFYTRYHVVILGDVNPGAEVIAGGSILIMGSLRGLAHAGKFGDEEQVVAALRMHPLQLRIAEHITRPPDQEPDSIPLPELARIREGKVMIEAMNL